MIKIGYYIKDKAFIDKIMKLYSYNREILSYELQSDSLEEIRDLKIDILIFDFNKDNTYQLDNFEYIKDTLKIKGICVLNEYTDELIQRVLKHNIQYMCDSFISEVGLYVIILRILHENEKLNLSVYERIEEICIQKGVSSHLKGFDYLQSAVLYYIENEKDSFRMKDVYDTIAKKYHTTSSRVEKNLRLAINASGSTLSNAKFVYECFKESRNE